MKSIAWIFRLLLWSFAACSIPAIADGNGTGGINAPGQRDKPYLLLISIDGFRWDYQDLYETPALDSLAARGVRAESMEPVYPTLTFPNHYSIATGLYPANHGIVANDFLDREYGDWYRYKQAKIVQQARWYDGVPIWVAAERSGMVSAAYFFIGTEAAVQGVAPTYWNRFDDNVSGARRIAQALEWLAMPVETRPHLIMLYFEHVDVDTHTYGVGSKESVAEIKRVDCYLGKLMDGIGKLPHADEVYVVLVSDHGQSSYDSNTKILTLDAFIDLDGITVIDGGTFVHLFFDKEDRERARQIQDQINTDWDHGRAWLPADAPEHWRVSRKSRFADVIVQADPHFAVLSSKDKMHKIHRGSHGWDPSFKDMHGMFLAAGPRLPQGKTIATISNLDVYPLMLEILELPLTTAIDGDPERLTKLLK